MSLVTLRMDPTAGPSPRELDERRGPFGRALRRRREVAGVSQSRLAERANYDHSYVSRLENGTRTPTREAVLTLAVALDLGEAGRDELLGAAGFLPGDPISLLASDPEVSALVRLLACPDVPADVRDQVRVTVAGLCRIAWAATGGAATSTMETNR